MVSMPTETAPRPWQTPRPDTARLPSDGSAWACRNLPEPNRLQPNVRAAMGGEAFRAANTWFATFREQVCVTGATITASVGSAATTLSVDNLIALATAFNTTDGAEDGGSPVVMLDLSRSKRRRPAPAPSPRSRVTWLGSPASRAWPVVSMTTSWAWE